MTTGHRQLIKRVLTVYPIAIATATAGANDGSLQTGETEDADVIEQSSGARAASSSTVSAFGGFFSLSVVMYATWYMRV